MQMKLKLLYIYIWCIFESDIKFNLAETKQ